MPFFQKWKPVPESERHCAQRNAGANSRFVAEDACRGDEHIQPKSNRKRQESQIDDDSHQPKEIFVILAVFDDTVIRSRRDQQRNNTDHWEERSPIQIAQVARKLVVAIFENTTKL